MVVMVETCCGFDVQLKIMISCLLYVPLDTNKPKKIYKIFGIRMSELRRALEWLEDNKVTDIFRESTVQYWIPVFSTSSKEILICSS